MRGAEANRYRPFGGDIVPVISALAILFSVVIAVMGLLSASSTVVFLRVFADFVGGPLSPTWNALDNFMARAIKFLKPFA